MDFDLSVRATLPVVDFVEGMTVNLLGPARTTAFNVSPGIIGSFSIQNSTGQNITIRWKRFRFLLEDGITKNYSNTSGDLVEV